MVFDFRAESGGVLALEDRIRHSIDIQMSPN